MVVVLPNMSTAQVYREPAAGQVQIATQKGKASLPKPKNNNPAMGDALPLGCYDELRVSPVPEMVYVVPCGCVGGIW